MANHKCKTTAILTRNIPLSVKAQFKAYCARHDYTMEAAIIALMRKAARDDTVLLEAGRVRKAQ